MPLLDFLKSFTKKSLTPAQLTGLMSQTTRLSNLGIKLDASYTDNQADEIVNSIGRYNVWLAGSIRAILRNIIQPVIKCYDTISGKDVEMPEYIDVLKAPNPWMDYTSFLKFLSFDYLFHGNAYCLKLKINEKTKGLLPLSSALVTVAASKDGMSVEYGVDQKGGRKVMTAADIVHWKDSDYGASYIKGTGMAQHLAYALALNNNADRYNVKSFENGGELKGVISSDQPLTQSDIDQVSDQWKQRYGGTDNAGKTAILGSGLTYQRTGQNNIEMGFEQLKRISKEEAMAITKVPPIELGDYGNASYANADIQRKLFWETLLIPMLESFASTLTKAIIRDGYNDQSTAYYFDTSSIPALQENITEKMQTVLSMQYAGYSNEQIGRLLDIEAPETNPADYTTPEPVPIKALVREVRTKSIIIPKSRDNVYREYVRDEWMKAHGINEAPYRRQLEKWVLGQRNTFNDWFRGETSKKSAGDEWYQLIAAFLEQQAAEDKQRLKGFSHPAFIRVNETAVKRMMDEYHIKWVDNEKSLLKINEHVTRVQRVDNTIKDQVLESVKAAISDSLEAQETTTAMADRIIQYTNQSYNISKKRALVIARTETTSVANDLSELNYREAGVEAKRWLTSRDELVRATHRVMEGETVGITEHFHVPAPKGLYLEQMLYPGDMTGGSAGNICNCRCTTVPEID